jgi:hypothetical protein
VSSSLALGAALRAIAALLDQAVAAAGISAFQGSRTSVLTPDLVDPATTVGSRPQLNIFPYHVALNPGWRNEDQPVRDTAGRPVERQLLALDVQIVVSAHAGLSYQAEVLLGIAMAALHDEPVLLRDRVVALLAPPESNTDALVAAFANARLSDQFERLKLAPLSLPPNEMQSLWQSLHGRYRPSFCYQLTTVLIDSRLEPRSGLPVRSVGALVLPFVRPLITAIEPPQAVFAVAGQSVALIGEDLVQPGAVVRFDSGERAPLETGSTNQRALVRLPATLPAGLIGLDLARPVAIGAPPDKDINASNRVVLIHRPLIARALDNAPDIAVIGSGTTRRLQIRLAPAARPGQPVELLLNRLGDPTGDGFRADGELGAMPATDPVEFAIPAIPAGQWVVRVRVAGAETELEVDAGGAFAGPVLVLP